MKIYLVIFEGYDEYEERPEAVFSTYKKAEEYCWYHPLCGIREFEVDADYERKETIWEVLFHYESGEIQKTSDDCADDDSYHSIHFLADPEYCCHDIPKQAPYVMIYVLATTIQRAQEKARDILEELKDFTASGTHPEIEQMMRKCYIHKRETEFGTLDYYEYPIYDHQTWTWRGWFTQF